MISIFEESFSGPMPHPRHLEQYERIKPGAADRMLAMAEKAQDHNIAMERLSVAAAIADERRGLYIGGTILALLVVAATISGTYYQNNICAGLLLGAAVLDVLAMMFKRNRE